MFPAPANNPYGAVMYGTAAISQALGGTDFQGPGCGVCWTLTGISGITNVASTIVLRGANTCPPSNPVCNNTLHFDIAAPGFDDPTSSGNNGCDRLEPELAEGLRACAEWPNTSCDCSAIGQTTLQMGCMNFLSLMWDNIEVDFAEVTCPPELMVTPCADDGTWPAEPIAQECEFFPQT